MTSKANKSERGINRVRFVTFGRIALAALALALLAFTVFAALNSRYCWLIWRPF